MDDARPLRILLVEDNDDHAELILRSLGDHHVLNKVTRAHDGAEALALLRNSANNELPDLMLLDLRLPKVDGLDVLSEVKSSDEWMGIPVVILTTSDAENDLARAYKLKANAYVTKPVDFSTFVKLMQDLGFFWLAWNRRPTRTD